MMKTALHGLTKQATTQASTCYLSSLKFQYHTRTIDHCARRLHLGASLARCRQGTSVKEIPTEESTVDVFLPSYGQQNRSTLTPTERAVFEQIYQDAAEQSARPAETAEEAVERVIQESTNPQALSIPLVDLFAQSRQAIQQSYQARAQDFLNSQLKGASHNSADPQIAASHEDLRVQKSHSEEIENELAAAQSDRDLWEVLQRKVFAPVEQFAIASNAEIPENQSTPRHPKKKGQRKRSSPANRSPSRVNRSDGFNRSPQLATELTIIQANYAYHCWIAQRSLRQRFPSSPYATAILPTVKALGPISYVLGTSTEFYNELLLLRWLHYRDLHTCADLRDEMLERGIPSNRLTSAVYRDAAINWLRTRKQQAQDESERDGGAIIHSTQRLQQKLLSKLMEAPATPFEQAWWSLEGTYSGFRRWQSLEAEAQARRQEEKAAAARAAREEAATEIEEGLTKANEQPHALSEAQHEPAVWRPGSSEWG